MNAKLWRRLSILLLCVSAQSACPVQIMVSNALAQDENRSGKEFTIGDDDQGNKLECCHGASRHPGHPKKPLFTRPGDVNRGECPPRRYLQCDHCRAGRPRDISRLASFSHTGGYAAGYVGGGVVLIGRPRGGHEGTWGMDYQGLLCPESIFLWWSGSRHQGGPGAYQTDYHPKTAIGRCANEVKGELSELAYQKRKALSLHHCKTVP